ncbi:MAG: hypothetical protein ACFKPT_13455 [Gloeotrichia echinulata GP01]
MHKEKIFSADMPVEQRHKILLSMSDAEIDYSDIPPLDELFSEDYINQRIRAKQQRFYISGVVKTVKVVKIINENSRRYIFVCPTKRRKNDRLWLKRFFRK